MTRRFQGSIGSSVSTLLQGIYNRGHTKRSGATEDLWSVSHAAAQLIRCASAPENQARRSLSPRCFANKLGACVVGHYTAQQTRHQTTREALLFVACTISAFDFLV